MRSMYVLFLVFIIPLTSCSKNDLVVPQKLKNTPITFYSFSANSANGKVKIEFSTSNSSNVKLFEIFSGSDGHQLCLISKIKPNVDLANSSNTYTFEDQNPKGNPTYYMLGYVAVDSTLHFNSQMLTVPIQN